MRINLLFAFIFVFSSCVVAQSKNKACEEFEYNLQVIKNYLENKDGDPHMERVKAVFFLESLTKIESSSLGTDIGKLDPTFEDYNAWKNWYKKNKNNLRWDEVNKEVYLVK